MRIREILVDWLTSSRYIKWLEARHIEQRQDYETRLGEKDSRIKELRTENAALKLECDRMRTVLMPYGSPAGAEYAQRYGLVEKPPPVPEFTGPDDWQAELNRMYEREGRDGLRGEGREEVHEPTANDGA